MVVVDPSASSATVCSQCASGGACDLGKNCNGGTARICGEKFSKLCDNLEHLYVFAVFEDRSEAERARV